jgi:[acyl-carrier-protein] S-malonyltransferase
VDGGAILVAEADARLAAMRTGPLASRLPTPDSAEGRNMRRWVAQVITVEAVIVREAGIRTVVAEPCDGDPRQVTLEQALTTGGDSGGVTAAVLAANPTARTLRRVIVAEVDVGQASVRSYYERNRDRYPQPYPEACAAISAKLGQVAREQAFARWLDERLAALVRLEPGFEHPSDPRNPRRPTVVVEPPRPA